jgi:RNA polymerase sigma-70 factor (ECF subfamily)
MTDEILVNRFLASRSERDFRILYQANTPALYRTALRLCGGTKEMAEELIQETWCVAIRKLPGFQWKSSLRTWLIGILINLSKELHRRNAKIMTNENTRQNQIHQNSFDLQSFDLENAIKALPPGYRQIVILHDVEGYTHHEIAEMLQITEGTSKSQLFHARKNLRDFLTK